MTGDIQRATFGAQGTAQEYTTTCLAGKTPFPCAVIMAVWRADRALRTREITYQKVVALAELGDGAVGIERVDELHDADQCVVLVQHRDDEYRPLPIAMAIAGIAWALLPE